MRTDNTPPARYDALLYVVHSGISARLQGGCYVVCDTQTGQMHLATSLMLGAAARHFSDSRIVAILDPERTVVFRTPHGPVPPQRFEESVNALVDPYDYGRALDAKGRYDRVYPRQGRLLTPSPSP